MLREGGGGHANEGLKDEMEKKPRQGIIGRIRDNKELRGRKETKT